MALNLAVETASETTRNLHFGDLVLDETCLFARRDGQTIQFTRNERALLLAFTGNPRRLMRRSRLLDEISSSDSDPSDRNIDFLVNRLRTKLGDSAKSSKFIATQYGEGYIWVAAPSSVAHTNAFLVIAPMLDQPPGVLGPQASSLVGAMRDIIAAGIGAEYRVVVVDNWRPAADDRLRDGLQMNFHGDDERLSCAATLREFPSKRIVRTFHLKLGDPAAAVLDQEIARISAGIVEFLRQAIAAAVTGLGTSEEAPLEHRPQQATTRLSASNPMWLASGERLRNDREQKPDNVDAALQWCLHLFSRLVLANPFDGMDGEERLRIESEIETIVLNCLPEVEAAPLLMLAAAKLLYFIDRGHLDLAEDLAERGLARTSDFAAALPILGQIRQARGHIEEAIILFDRGIGMAEPGSQFLLHMQVLKCIALLAAGDRAGLNLAADFSLDSPHCPRDIAALIGLMLAPEDRPLPASLAAVLAEVGPDGARRAIEMVFFTSARQLTSEGARANIMRGLIARVSGLHGPQSVPAFVLASIGLVPPQPAAELGGSKAVDDGERKPHRGRRRTA